MLHAVAYKNCGNVKNRLISSFFAPVYTKSKCSISRYGSRDKGLDEQREAISGENTKQPKIVQSAQMW